MNPKLIQYFNQNSARLLYHQAFGDNNWAHPKSFLADIARQSGEPIQRSGRQELFEQLVSRFT